MSQGRPEAEENKASLEARLEPVRRLISNQYAIVHHTESYIFDIAKTASIVLGVIALVGIPQLLSFTSSNRFLFAVLRGLGAGLIAYAVICGLVILQAVSSVGGLNLKMEAGFRPSLWWYSEERFAHMKANDQQSNEQLITQVNSEFKAETGRVQDEETFDREVLTFTLLVLRTELQLKVARRLRGLLVYGLPFSFGALCAGVSIFFLLP